MERAVTIARTNLADNETNVNRLRVPQFGIVAFKLSASGKESKTYLQPGVASVAGAGTDDFHFVPDKESITIAYEIDDTCAIVDEGTLELFTRFKKDPLWTLDLAKLGRSWLAHGQQEVKWDGRVVKSAESPGTSAAAKTAHDLGSLAPKEMDGFPDGYLTLEHSPYKLKLTLKSDLFPKRRVVAWTYFQIVLKGIELELGPEEAIPKAFFFGGDKLKMDKEVRGQIDAHGGLPAAAAPGPREVRLVSNIFKTSGSQMMDNTGFELYEKMWGHGPNIPVFAKIRLADSSGSEVKLESDRGAVALGNARFLWEWLDPDEVPTNGPRAAPPSGSPASFISRAINYDKNRTEPKGDNCHVDRGGKRGPKAEPVFSEQSGYSPQSTLKSGDFPFKVEQCNERKWAAFSRPWTKGKLAGKTGVVFQASRMAGDDYKLRVYLAWEHDKDGKYALDVKTDDLGKTVDAAIQAETGKLQIWRDIQIVRYVRKRGAVATFINAANETAIKKHYKLAYINVDFAPLNAIATESYEFPNHRLKNGKAPEYDKICAAALDRRGDALLTNHIASDPAANHVADASMFRLRLYPEFVKELHLNLHSAAGAADIATAAATAMMTPDDLAYQLGKMPVAGWPVDALHTRLKATRARLISDNLEEDYRYANYLTDVLPDLIGPVLDKLEVLSGLNTAAPREAADGISIIHFDHLHNVVRDLAVRKPALMAPGVHKVGVLRGMAFDPGDASHHRCAFVMFVQRIDTFVHEIGHHLFLPHTRFNGGPAERHDDDDSICIMSYNENRDVFCGLCQLRLRGWSAEALDKDDAKNEKV
ncbi:MAG: hypothetical protein AUG04_08445 [Deltaproteobacteria bacterium 13_1_20CM_2_69_21]|nr:MAG: hypothetical protein AUG04_08445 [Deltaproteobacteria bacterium 13_1_20CM_2_69_21]